MTPEEIEETRRRLEAQGGIPPLRRPPRPRYLPTKVMLDAEDTAELDALAKASGRSRSDLVREAVRKVWLKGRKGTRGGG